MIQIIIIQLNDVQQPTTTTINQHITNKQSNKTELNSKRLTSVTQLVKQQQQFNINAAPGEGRHSLYAKNDILQMLNQGLTLRLIIPFYLSILDLNLQNLMKIIFKKTQNFCYLFS